MGQKERKMKKTINLRNFKYYAEINKTHESNGVSNDASSRITCMINEKPVYLLYYNEIVIAVRF